LIIKQLIKLYTDENNISQSRKQGFCQPRVVKGSPFIQFRNWYDPEKVHFGLLRVLNDDIVAPAQGFGSHPHNDMEIITIPHYGALWHTDNIGNEEVITAGEVQVMSAGSGVMHSEFNASKTEELILTRYGFLPTKKITSHGTTRKRLKLPKTLIIGNCWFSPTAATSRC
jgi:hypothetical protein